MKIHSASELLSVLEKKKIAVYGAGYVAKQFQKALRLHHMDGQIRAFVTTDGKGQPISSIDLIPIRDLQNIPYDILCVAVHESLLNEIKEMLEKKGINNFVWIYPYVYEMLIGDPVSTHVEVPIRDILSACPEDYSIPARCLVIDEYHGKNGSGYEIYKKSFSSFSTDNTADARLQRFLDLITNVERDGFDSQERIKINDCHIILDGTHRTAIACELKKESILCDIFQSETVVHNPDMCFFKTNLGRFGITAKEEALLEQKRKELYDFYEISGGNKQAKQI